MSGGGDYPKRKSSGISWRKLLSAFVPIKGRLETFGVPRLLTGLFDGSAAILIFDFFFLFPLKERCHRFSRQVSRIVLPAPSSGQEGGLCSKQQFIPIVRTGPAKVYPLIERGGGLSFDFYRSFPGPKNV